MDTVKNLLEEPPKSTGSNKFADVIADAVAMSKQRAKESASHAAIAIVDQDSMGKAQEAQPAGAGSQEQLAQQM